MSTVAFHTASAASDSLIIDTHQHLWDQSAIIPPWLKGAPAILQHDYSTAEYLTATAGLNIKAIYMEIDVAAKDHIKEAEAIVRQCLAANTPTVGATIGGRPASADFESYVKRYSSGNIVKGLRQVLHSPATPSGFCLSKEFVHGVQTLGKHGLNFEITIRSTELQDAAKMIQECPDTAFVLDHCGNGDPKAFNPKLCPDLKRSCTADAWKRGIEAIAAQPKVMCKISGIISSIPSGQWHVEDLAPVVNHCLDSFGPDRVFFGGDWPVCLLGGAFSDWMKALQQIISSRPANEQQKLWSQNAIKFYSL